MSSVRTDRPRIFFTPASLAALKAQAAAGSDRWLKVKQAADTPASWDSGLENYALAYVVTGDAAYAQKALSLLLPSCADSLNAITPDSGYQARNNLPAIAICLDWLYPILAADQKATIIAAAKLWASWVWPETNPARKGAWGVDDPGSNYYQAFLFSWMVGLSLAGEDPIADTLIAVARNRFTAEVMPYLATSAAGGIFPEGLGYGVGSTGFLLWNLLANLSATGEDLIAATPWCHDAVSALIQFTNPAMRELAPLGDLAAGPLNDYTRRVMSAMSGHDARCGPYLDQMTPNTNLQMLTRWEEVVFRDGSILPSSQPTFYSAPGVGAVSSRTNETKTATQIVAVCGPTLESHQDRAQGEFLIAWGADWLAGQAKLVTHSGLDQATIDHNCVTCDGLQQTWTQNTCRYLAQEDTPDYTFLQMDLTGAYAGQLSAYVRELFWLKPDLLVVRDIPKVVNPLSKLQWNLQVLTAPVLGRLGDFAVTAPGSTHLFGIASSLFSVMPVQADADSGTSYRLMLAPDAAGEFLVALEPAPASQAVLTVGTVARTGLRGATWNNMLVAAVTAPLPFTYPSPVDGRHYLYGLKPNTLYSVTGLAPMRSSAAGVISLVGPGIGQPVTISEGALPPPPPPAARSFMVTVPPGGPATISEVPGKEG